LKVTSHRRPEGFQAPFEVPDEAIAADAPLAARMRPRSLAEFIGQRAAVGPGTMLRGAVERGHLPSFLLWGPPGCGKTTLARLAAKQVRATFVSISAVASGVAELRRIVADARSLRAADQRTVVFIDEIHRFNKAQQDVILPYVEDGTITLIGATTENPSFEVVAPLLSRVRVIRLLPLGDDDILAIAAAALRDEERGLGRQALALDEEAARLLAEGSNGDARAALTALEIAAAAAGAGGRRTIAAADVHAALADRRPYHDKQADFHYDTVSAFIKSIRGSDPDAALYWLARMVEAGEDPLFVVRRMVILAAEDVGLADPHALGVATACQQAVHFIGMPEGYLPMAECALYLALAPKSNSALSGYLKAKEAAIGTSHLPVPDHLRNAATGLMRQLGYGQGYRYAHDEAAHFATGMTYLPESLVGQQYYVPGHLGFEAGVAARLARLRRTEPDDSPDIMNQREPDED